MTDGYKIKRVLVWQNGVEKQIYPAVEPIVNRATQGPSPDGFHVPTKDEWVSLHGVLTSTLGLSNKGSTMQTYLKMPVAGYRAGTNSNAYSQDSYGQYWSSTPFSGTNQAYYLTFTSSGVIGPQNGLGRSNADSIRCFKNTPVTPDNTWTKLYGTNIESGGIYWNSTLGLISISGNGTTWYTIQDKNLGATTVWNSGDTLSESNCGKYYQWGNNYGFAWTGSVTTSSTRVNASTYGPGNYYSSNRFIITTSSPYDWTSPSYDNLRGGVTGNVPVS